MKLEGLRYQEDSLEVVKNDIWRWPDYLMVAFVMAVLSSGCKTSESYVETPLIENWDPPRMPMIEYYLDDDRIFIESVIDGNNMHQNMCMIDILWDDRAKAWMVDNDLSRTLQICEIYSELKNIALWPYRRDDLADLINGTYSILEPSNEYKNILLELREKLNLILRAETRGLPNFKKVESELTAKQHDELMFMLEFGDVVRARKIFFMYEIIELLDYHELMEEC